MGKNRDLLKKMRDTKGTFHAKNGLNKGLEQCAVTAVSRDGGLVEQCAIKAVF